MKLFKKEKTPIKVKYTIFGIMLTLKKSLLLPSEMNIVKRTKVQKKYFYDELGYPLNVNNPRTFNEKINWMKLFYQNPILTRIVDKYEFKNYIKEKLGDGYTVPLLGAWDNVDDIDFSQLPNQFVLKCNAQSDGKFIKIVKNKEKLDINALKQEMKNWLISEYTLKSSFCWAYYNVPLKIIAEEYIEQIDGQVYDYKFFCFNGEPKFIYVAIDHFPGRISKISLFDLNWKHMNIKYGKHPNIDIKIDKPKNFDKMLEISKTLSKEFPFVRVDFYEIGNKVLLGEMTFYPGGGYNILSPSKWDQEFGSYINLPKIKIKSPFFEKVKNKNKRIIKIWGKKVFSYYKSFSRKKLTKELETTKAVLKSLEDNIKLIKNELKAIKSELNATKSELKATKNELNATKSELINNTKQEKKRINSRFDDDRLMTQKMFNYLNRDNLKDEYKKVAIEDRFYREVGYFPNIDNPRTFNEKINWLKMYYKNDDLSRCVDKYEFKNYIKEQLGEGYIVPLLGAWDNANDIDLTKLPDKFVLKVNWSSYQNFIVKDKNKFNFDYAKRCINTWMLPWRNVYWSSFYWAYKNVIPKVIAEEYIEQPDGKLNDYKFYCFNGTPKYLYIVDEDYSSKSRPLCWDVDDNHMFKIIDKKIDSPKQPKNMDIMLELASKLAKPFPFVRVDFYETGDKVYVGELTFYPGNGFNKFTPKSLDEELGELLDLSTVKQKYLADAS